MNASETTVGSRGLLCKSKRRYLLAFQQADTAVWFCTAVGVRSAADHGNHDWTRVSMATINQRDKPDAEGWQWRHARH